MSDVLTRLRCLDPMAAEHDALDPHGPQAYRVRAAASTAPAPTLRRPRRRLFVTTTAGFAAAAAGAAILFAAGGSTPVIDDARAEAVAAAKALDVKKLTGITLAETVSDDATGTVMSTTQENIDLVNGVAEPAVFRYRESVDALVRTFPGRAEPGWGEGPAYATGDSVAAVAELLHSVRRAYGGDGRVAIRGVLPKLTTDELQRENMAAGPEGGDGGRLGPFADLILGRGDVSSDATVLFSLDRDGDLERVEFTYHRAFPTSSPASIDFDFLPSAKTVFSVEYHRVKR